MNSVLCTGQRVGAGGPKNGSSLYVVESRVDVAPKASFSFAQTPVHSSQSFGGAAMPLLRRVPCSTGDGCFLSVVVRFGPLGEAHTLCILSAALDDCPQVSARRQVLCGGWWWRGRNYTPPVGS